MNENEIDVSFSYRFLPCPFCGSSNVVLESYYEESYARCLDCGAEGPVSNCAEGEKLWNNRN